MKMTQDQYQKLLKENVKKALIEENYTESVEFIPFNYEDLSPGQNLIISEYPFEEIENNNNHILLHAKYQLKNAHKLKERLKLNYGLEDYTSGYYWGNKIILCYYDLEINIIICKTDNYFKEKIKEISSYFIEE